MAYLLELWGQRNHIQQGIVPTSVKRRLSPIINKCATLACLIFLLAGTSIGASISTQRAVAQYRIDVFDTEAGLPQNSVTGLRLSHDGYIWVTTNDGLARFDGVRFTVFNRSNSPELPTNRLTGVFEDKSGRLWFQGEDGSVLFYKHSKFTLALRPGVI